MIELAKLIHLSTIEIEGAVKGIRIDKRPPVYRRALYRGKPARKPSQTTCSPRQ